MIIGVDVGNHCHQWYIQIQFGVNNYLITPSFSLSLPPPWGIPLAWSLSALPLLPLLGGLLVHLVLAGVKFSNLWHHYHCQCHHRHRIGLLAHLVVSSDFPLNSFPFFDFSLHPYGYDIPCHPHFGLLYSSILFYFHSLFLWIMYPLISVTGGQGRGKQIRTSFIPSARW